MQTKTTTAVRPFEAFWREQTRSGSVRLLVETNTETGGSLVVSIDDRFVVWEVWGIMSAAILKPSVDALIQAAQAAKSRGRRLSGFFDFGRMESLDDSGQQQIISFRQSLSQNLHFARTGVIFDGAMSQISYDMANLLYPPPWEERVFPTVDEALQWLQDPVNTNLLDVDGLNWVV